MTERKIIKIGRERWKRRKYEEKKDEKNEKATENR